jgi:DNA-binding protein YbaB
MAAGNKGLPISNQQELAIMEFDFQEARNSLHKLNNKISQILVYAELLQMTLTGEKERERVKIIISGALESREITSKLMSDFPRKEDSETV